MPSLFARVSQPPAPQVLQRVIGKRIHLGSVLLCKGISFTVSHIDVIDGHVCIKCIKGLSVTPSVEHAPAKRLIAESWGKEVVTGAIVLRGGLRYLVVSVDPVAESVTIKRQNQFMNGAIVVKGAEIGARWVDDRVVTPVIPHRIAS